MDNLAVSAKRARSTISASDGSVPMLSSAISALLSQSPRWGKPDQKAGYVHHPRRCGNVLNWSVIERALFVATFIGFVVTMAIPDFRTQNFCSLRAWRWAILITTAFCGSKLIDIVATTPKREKMQGYVTLALVCLTISAILWLVKILVTKKLELNRYKTIYFERLKSALFFQYVLETFILLPANKMAKELVFAAKVPKKEGSEELFVTSTLDEWDAIDAQNVSALTLMDFIHVIEHTTLHEYMGEILKHKTSISNESQCERAADLMSGEIFNRISGNGV
ncbi:hypothetical protein RHMOL_Rhmol02G0223900 [Rhododendron molle]|uniref:Uncharacterized protein n=1 Tax=Rhododendron molle TaxID=49168 RepID=A0ACC0PUJ5_RHOML|nr:hypothetical protein RHMOL_Rhmol02G0223900 [Rhododendron molle]